MRLVWRKRMTLKVIGIMSPHGKNICASCDDISSLLHFNTGRMETNIKTDGIGIIGPYIQYICD